jgi:hypothetical protein
MFQKCRFCRRLVSVLAVACVTCGAILPASHDYSHMQEMPRHDPHTHEDHAPAPQQRMRLVVTSSASAASDTGMVVDWRILARFLTASLTEA